MNINLLKIISISIFISGCTSAVKLSDFGTIDYLEYRNMDESKPSKMIPIVRNSEGCFRKEDLDEREVITMNFAEHWDVDRILFSKELDFEVSYKEDGVTLKSVIAKEQDVYIEEATCIFYDKFWMRHSTFRSVRKSK